MDDATKAFAKPLSWPEPDQFPVDPELHPGADGSTVPEAEAEKPVSTAAS